MSSAFSAEYAALYYVPPTGPLSLEHVASHSPFPMITSSHPLFPRIFTGTVAPIALLHDKSILLPI